MLQEVALGQKSLTDYTHIVGKETTERIRELAEPLKGKRVLHVSATAFGGGVSEILYTIVPLMRDVGLDAHWHVIFGKEEFFNATKLLHNSLQGAEETLSDEQWAAVRRDQPDERRGPAGRVGRGDRPRPAADRPAPRRPGEGQALDLALPHRPLDPEPGPDRAPAAADRGIRRDRLAPAGLRAGGGRPQQDGVNIIPPAIDPLSPKNMAFSPEDAAFVCRQFGIDPDRPLITQVSRFDPWKDPIGVIDAYREVTEQVPEAQLAMVGSMASDDPEGREYFQKTYEYADNDPDIKILSNLNNVGAIEVNAFQSQSDVCLQKSIREGFGLTVTEALWKGRPTIGGNVGGIPLQIENGETGFLVNSPSECAQRCLEILADPELGKRLGRAGKEHARREFLSPRLLRDWLGLLTDLDT